MNEEDSQKVVNEPTFFLTLTLHQSRMFGVGGGFPRWSNSFTLIKGSMNCLICDAIMSSTYLAKYAAGVEEHATVKISGESSETVSVGVKKMKNIKIAGARISASEESDKSSAETCRLLSSTECIWSMLKLKNVFPTYTCIHVNTLPIERRSCVQRRQKYRRQVDLSGQNDQDLQFANVRKSMSLPEIHYSHGIKKKRCENMLSQVCLSIKCLSLLYDHRSCYL